MRLDIFVEYPYLYRGQRAAELAYLASYAEKPGGCVMLAEDNGTVIGAATGMPLRHEEAALRDPVANTTPWPIDHLYSVGELLFRPAYRPRGLGQRLLRVMENYIRTLGYRKIVCVRVERPMGHPLRPSDTIPIDRFLTRLDGVTTDFSWLEMDGVKRDHIMQFWLKDLLKDLS